MCVSDRSEVLLFLFSRQKSLSCSLSPALLPVFCEPAAMAERNLCAWMGFWLSSDTVGGALSISEGKLCRGTNANTKQVVEVG